jgi:hypothetical protein
MKHFIKFLIILSLVSFTQLSAGQTNAVITVPYNPNDLSAPFPAYSAARITLKAIFRSSQSTGTYSVRWDENLNGDVSDDPETLYSMNSNQFINIGKAITLPVVSQKEFHNIIIRVHDNTSGMDYFGSYPVSVENFEPSTDPRDWTDEQVHIMNEITKQEALWFLHRSIIPAGTAYSAQITGSLPEQYAIAMALTLFLDNNRYPAYPPNSMNTYGFTIPERWTLDNNARWNTDPYTETALRLLNYLVNNLYEFSGIPVGDESALCGYNTDGSEITGTRIDGTFDGKGLFNTITNFSDDGLIANEGMMLEAISKTLPVLSGTPAQIGKTGVISKSFEYIVQQMVDAITFGQQDNSAPHNGGWYYDLAQGSYTNVEASQWDIWGLMAADKFGKPCGVMVTNLVKYRLANYLVNVQNTNGGVRRWTSYPWCNNFNYTSSAISAARWLGVDTFETTETAIPFAAYSTHSKGTLRTVYNKYLNFATNNWTMSIASDCLGYQDGLWVGGDYLSGNTNGIYNVTSNGNTFTMMAFAKSLPQPKPVINLIGTPDWQREFAIYYQRAQKKDPTTYSTFGSIDDSWCSIWSQCCNGGSFSNTALGGFAITRNTQSIDPFADLNGNSDMLITAACAGSGYGEVVFDPSSSYSPYINNPIDSVQIDVDSADGIWWENGADPDFAVSDPLQTYAYTFTDPGVYVASLRVFDSYGLTDMVQIGITADAGVNEALAANAAGPYTMTEGEDITLSGTGDDPNIPCGDEIVFDWDINNDGGYDIFDDASPSITWATLSAYALSMNTANDIRLKVTDSEGLSTESTSTLTIYQLNPEAQYTYSPETVNCNEEIDFDATGSYHPNPDRTIELYEWDFNHDGVFEETGITVSHTFMTTESYIVTLKVTDSEGQSDVSEMEITVLAGTNLSPTADAGGPYTMTEGEDIILSGTGDDPNIPCGDQIVFDWDINNDGGYDIFDDASPSITWATLSAYDLSLNTAHTIRLKVTDLESLSTESTSTLTIYQLNPVAGYTYSHETVYCNEEIDFDASGSYHPNPERTIETYEWDFDNDGVFEETGITVSHTFTAYGNVTVNLRIVDDLGHTDTYTLSMDVQLINQAPFAEINESVYAIAEGSDLFLDASESSDPNEDCGDAIVLYEWDIDNNGSYEDAIDQTGVTPSILWNDMETLFPFPANYETGEPFQTIGLRVTDAFSASAETEAIVRIYSPVAITQNPSDLTVDNGSDAEFTVAASGSEPFDYQWYKNGEELVNANSSALTLSNVTPDDEGDYACLVSNQETNALSETAHLYVNQTNINGLTDAFDINLYPNPTSSTITIELNNPNVEKMTIEIVNAAGEIVYLSVEAGIGDAFKKQLIIENLNTGVYFCKISMGNYFTVRKIIKY